MRTLFKNFDVISEYSSHKELIQAGYTVEQIVRDLFELLFMTLWDMPSSLRKYVIFYPAANLENEVLAFQKPDRFIRRKLKDTGIRIPFTGVLKKDASGKEVVAYIKDIVLGYSRNEETLVMNMKTKLPEIYKNCLADHGVTLNETDLPLMYGLYHSHELNIESTVDRRFRLEGMSNISLFL